MAKGCVGEFLHLSSGSDLLVYSVQGAYSLSPILSMRDREEVLGVLGQLQGAGLVSCSRVANQPHFVFSVQRNVIAVLPFQHLISCGKPQKEGEMTPICIDCEEVIKPNATLRERLRHIHSLHDLCEEYIESIGLPASEYLREDGLLKICRVELGHTMAIEGRGETWKQARTRAALEVVFRLDKELCEYWLSQHITEFAAFLEH